TADGGAHKLELFLVVRLTPDMDANAVGSCDDAFALSQITQQAADGAGLGADALQNHDAIHALFLDADPAGLMENLGWVDGGAIEVGRRHAVLEDGPNDGGAFLLVLWL